MREEFRRIKQHYLLSENDERDYVRLFICWTPHGTPPSSSPPLTIQAISSSRMALTLPSASPSVWHLRCGEIIAGSAEMPGSSSLQWPYSIRGWPAC